MTILVVGSVAYDSVKTPFGEVENALGGSATYFSVAASFFSPVQLVAIVGEDFREEDEDLLRGRDVNIDGLVRSAGKTFHWKGEYGYDLNDARTLETHLNVFEGFDPDLPSEYRKSKYVFLANIDPDLQAKVLKQVERPTIVASDTMNYWIENKPEALKRTIRNVDILLINDAEARQLANEANLVKAAGKILAMGPGTVVVKRGEFGVLMFTPDSCFSAPAFPLEEVMDPTGSGDSFAGGFLGYLAKSNVLDEENVRRAVIFGSVMASFNVEDFSLKRISRLTLEEIEQRYREFKKLTQFENL